MYTVKFIIEIMEDIEEHFIRNKTIYTVSKKYKYLEEALKLYAKQHNHIRSILLLINSNMYEEAYILSRTVLNTYYLIEYLVSNYENEDAFIIYKAQTLLNNIKHLKNKIEIFDIITKKSKVNFTKLEILTIKSDMEKDLENLEKEKLKIDIKDKRKLKVFSILELAKDIGEYGYFSYNNYYRDASRYEHSDKSTLEIYKNVSDEYNLDQNNFIMDINRTDTKLIKNILDIIKQSYVSSFFIIAKNMFKENIFSESYDENKIKEIIDKCMKK